jgi:PEP-CTERM motif
MPTSITRDLGRKWARGAVALAVVALAAAASPASATVIFSDDFDANALALNSTPAGWSVGATETVDIVGPGLFGELCAGGPSPSACIDLDGSTLNAANLQTSVVIPTAGSYLLSFWLQANDRGFGTDNVTVSFGGGYSELFTLTSLGNDLDSWAFYQRVVNFGGAGAQTLSFDHAGGDNIGILLDNVQVETAVPEPGTLLLLGSGLTAFAARRRRRSS